MEHSLSLYNTVAPNMPDTVLYEVDATIGVAYLTLNRPSRLNAINGDLPFALRDAVSRANGDANVSIIVVRGSGRAFCSGYDLHLFAESSERGVHPCSQEMPWDPTLDFQVMKQYTDCYMSLFHSYKPTIAQVHGFAVAGGSDIALCCDFVFMTDTAKIGYPPARVWGCPTTFMWVYRLGMEQAKRMVLTGDLISGKEAERIGLILKSLPDEEALRAHVKEFATKMARIPNSQLFMCKQVVNQAVELKGLAQTQRLATLFDGITRHSPEGIDFQQISQRQGFKVALQHRDQPNSKADSKFRGETTASLKKIEQKFMPEFYTRAKL